MSGIVVAAIAPHGGIAVAELCDESELDTAAATRAVSKSSAAVSPTRPPESVCVLTPPPTSTSRGRWR